MGLRGDSSLSHRQLTHVEGHVEAAQGKAQFRKMVPQCRQMVPQYRKMVSQYKCTTV